MFFDKKKKKIRFSSFLIKNIYYMYNKTNIIVIFDMGTCQTRTEELSEFSDKFIENFSQNHEYVSETHHPIYGPIQVWKEKGGVKYVMIISKNWRTEWEQEEFNEEISKRMKYDHPNLIRMLGWKKNFSDRVCSLSESYDLYAPLNQRNLGTELEKRGKCLVNIKIIIFFHEKT